MRCPWRGVGSLADLSWGLPGDEQGGSRGEAADGSAGPLRAGRPCLGLQRGAHARGTVHFPSQAGSPLTPARGLLDAALDFPLCPLGLCLAPPGLPSFGRPSYPMPTAFLEPERRGGNSFSEFSLFRRGSEVTEAVTGTVSFTTKLNPRDLSKETTVHHVPSPWLRGKEEGPTPLPRTPCHVPGDTTDTERGGVHTGSPVHGRPLPGPTPCLPPPH